MDLKINFWICVSALILLLLEKTTSAIGDVLDYRSSLSSEFKSEDEPKKQVELGAFFSKDVDALIFASLDKKVDRLVCARILKLLQRKTFRLTRKRIRKPKGRRFKFNKTVILPSVSMQQMTRARASTALIDEVSEQIHSTSSEIVEKYDLSLIEINKCLGLFSQLLPTETFDRCKSEIFGNHTCSRSYKYRSTDGSCNNLKHPEWGKSPGCYSRLIPADYDDGLSAPRFQSKNKRPLPNPRSISLLVHQKEPPDVLSNFSSFFVTYSQFLDHDITLSPVNLGKNNEKIDCCASGALDKHPECSEILVEVDDPHYSQYNYRCINMVRAAACPNDCKLGSREHVNQNTAYIDGSNIYSSFTEDIPFLRIFEGGRLRVNYTATGEESLPLSRQADIDQCSRPAENKFCYWAGDQRVNEHPSLSILHTLWVRQHNRIARELEALVPGASDEILYQEARRIVTAMMECIVYKEFLPIVLGPRLMTRFKLKLLTKGFTAYNPTVNVAIPASFVTAAYRFGHTMIYKKMFTIDENGYLASYPFEENYLKPFCIAEGRLDRILNGHLNGRCQKCGTFMSHSVTSHLFKSNITGHGLDLCAINIKRGREKGIPAYVQFLEFCTEIVVKEWNDLLQVMNQEAVEKLRLIYSNVDEIDLFTGGTSETPVPSGLVGPTFACIIGITFHRLKVGDRFYFEHGHQAGSFTKEQLKEIRSKSTMAMVIAKNTKIQHISENVFLPDNEKKPASFYEDLDYSKFKTNLENLHK